MKRITIGRIIRLPDRYTVDFHTLRLIFSLDNPPGQYLYEYWYDRIKPIFVPTAPSRRLLDMCLFKASNLHIPHTKNVVVYTPDLAYLHEVKCCSAKARVYRPIVIWEADTGIACLLTGYSNKQRLLVLEPSIARNIYGKMKAYSKTKYVFSIEINEPSVDCEIQVYCAPIETICEGNICTISEGLHLFETGTDRVLITCRKRVNDLDINAGHW